MRSPPPPWGFARTFFSTASSHLKENPCWLYSFCDLGRIVCVSVTYVYFILNPTVTPSRDKSCAAMLSQIRENKHANQQ